MSKIKQITEPSQIVKIITSSSQSEIIYKLEQDTRKKNSLAYVTETNRNKQSIFSFMNLSLFLSDKCVARLRSIAYVAIARMYSSLNFFPFVGHSEVLNGSFWVDSKWKILWATHDQLKLGTQCSLVLSGETYDNLPSFYPSVNMDLSLLYDANTEKIHLDFSSMIADYGGTSTFYQFGNRRYKTSRYIWMDDSNTSLYSSGYDSMLDLEFERLRTISLATSVMMSFISNQSKKISSNISLIGELKTIYNEMIEAIAELGELGEAISSISDSGSFDMKNFLTYLMMYPSWLQSDIKDIVCVSDKISFSGHSLFVPYYIDYDARW